MTGPAVDSGRAPADLGLGFEGIAITCEPAFGIPSGLLTRHRSATIIPLTPMPELFDVTIIGAGPVGMFAAYYAGFRRLKTKVIDSLSEPGGQITALYPDKAIYDVAGFTAVTGKDLVENLFFQMSQYKPTLCFGQRCQTLEQTPEGHWLLGTDQEAHLTKTLLIATGIGTFTPRKLERAECAQWEGRGLTYVMQDPEQYRGKTVVIVGGGDSAVDWANHLAVIARQVYVVHRRNEFRAHEASVEKMRAHAIVKTPAQVKAIRGNERVEAVVLQRGAGEPDEIIATDAVLAFLGFVSGPGPLVEWGLELHKDEIVINQRTETNLPGVYAAGDCAYFPGRPKLIAVGFGEAAVAINNMAVYIDPKKSVFPGHSSNQKETART